MFCDVKNWYAACWGFDARVEEQQGVILKTGISITLNSGETDVASQGVIRFGFKIILVAIRKMGWKGTCL